MHTGLGIASIGLAMAIGQFVWGGVQPVLGATRLATVPPTAGLTAKLFGTRHLATPFGLTLLSHQIGGFLGAWLGGVAVVHSGNYLWMWWADAILALGAALLSLPIREAHLTSSRAAAWCRAPLAFVLRPSRRDEQTPVRPCAVARYKA